MNSRNGDYRAQLRRATPPGTNTRLYAQLKRRARYLTIATGAKHVVDHIVPLANPIVCGLHVPANWRITLEPLNAEKSNHWWPDMPNEQLHLFHNETSSRQLMLPLIQNK